MWLRLREQCLRSKITSVARVEIVLLLRFVAGNVDVNTLASKRSELLGNADILRMRRVKPAFHGACFGAVSAPILSARVPRRTSAAFEKERFHYEHSSCFHGADCRAD